MYNTTIRNSCAATWISIIVLPTGTFAKSVISTFNNSALSRDIRQLSEKQGSNYAGVLSLFAY
jgi:hypothetical protein